LGVPGIVALNNYLFGAAYRLNVPRKCIFIYTVKAGSFWPIWRNLRNTYSRYGSFLNAFPVIAVEIIFLFFGNK